MHNEDLLRTSASIISCRIKNAGPNSAVTGLVDDRCQRHDFEGTDEVPVPEVHNSSKAASNAASEPSGLQARTGRIFPSPDASTHRLGVRKLHETEGAPHLRSLHRCPRAMRSCPQSEVSAQASARFVHFEGLVLVVATMHND